MATNQADSSVKTDSITLDVVDDKTGRQGKVKLNARFVSPSTSKDAIYKRIENKDVPTSNGTEKKRVFENRDQVVQPPYDLNWLSKLPEHSTELGQNVRAMVTNTVGFGWKLEEREMPDKVRTEFIDEIEEEKFRLEANLNAIHPIYALTQLREKEVYDKHVTGNGYLELIENRVGDLIGIDHIPGHCINMTYQDDESVLVKVPVIRPDKDFEIEERDMYHKFRRFVMILNSGRKIWFKEAGDPRALNISTGEFAENVEDLEFCDRATALIHNRIYSPLTPYGIPLYIGNSVGIAGSRESEEINYNSIANNMIPSMFVIIENGMLTESSIQRLSQWTEKQVAASKNHSTFIILEGESMDDGVPDPGKFRIKIEPLKSQQQNDQLFQNYDANNRDKLRQSFRLPPIFVGRSGDYTRATALVSRDIADGQVFAPERRSNDQLINRHIMTRWEAKFHSFKSNGPDITDDAELVKLMGISERSGAMTPRRADRITRDVFRKNLGPMPKGIDLDVPYGISFANAQKGDESETKPLTVNDGGGGVSPDESLKDPTSDSELGIENT